MINYKTISKYLFYFSALFIFSISAAQDKIYKTDGTIFIGKVTRVEPTQIHVTAPDGPEYTMNVMDLDSIVYANGRHEKMGGYVFKKNLHENIPQLNTWSLDLLGFYFLSVSQSYERRLKNGKVGFRIPLYIGLKGGGLAGVGNFDPTRGVYYTSVGPQYKTVYNSIGFNSGFSISTGINPKFYLFKHRIVRVFAGPEADIGYSVITGYYTDYFKPGVNFGYPTTPWSTYRCGTFAMLGSFGLSINPVDKFNITLHGAAGAGNVFGSNNPIGWTGLWQIGFSLGTNW